MDRIARMENITLGAKYYNILMGSGEKENAFDFAACKNKIKGG